MCFFPLVRDFFRIFICKLISVLEFIYLRKIQIMNMSIFNLNNVPIGISTLLLLLMQFYIRYKKADSKQGPNYCH